MRAKYQFKKTVNSAVAEASSGNQISPETQGLPKESLPKESLPREGLLSDLYIENNHQLSNQNNDIVPSIITSNDEKCNNLTPNHSKPITPRNELKSKKWPAFRWWHVLLLLYVIYKAYVLISGMFNGTL